MGHEEEARCSCGEERRDRLVLAAAVKGVEEMLKAKSPTSRQYTELARVVKSELTYGGFATVTETAGAA